MALINAIANGNKDATTTWSGGAVPGPADDVNLNGFVVDIATNWSIASLTDGGNSGSGAYVSAAGLTIDISGALDSTTLLTSTSQSCGANGLSAPQYALLNYQYAATQASQSTLNCGSISSTGAAAVGASFPKGLTISAGSISVNGFNSAANTRAAAISLYYPQKCVLNVSGSIDVSGGALGVNCQCSGPPNNAIQTTDTLVVTCPQINVSSTSGGAQSIGFYGAPTVTGDALVTGGSMLVQGDQSFPTVAIWDGNIQLTDSLLSQNVTWCIAGILSANGNMPSQYALGFSTSPALCCETLDLSNGAIVQTGLLVTESFLCDATSSVINTGYWLHVGPLPSTYAVPAGSHFEIPAPSQVLSGMSYMPGPLLGTLRGTIPVNLAFGGTASSHGAERLSVGGACGV